MRTDVAFKVLLVPDLSYQLGKSIRDQGFPVLLVCCLLLELVEYEIVPQVWDPAECLYDDVYVVGGSDVVQANETWEKVCSTQRSLVASILIQLHHLFLRVVRV